MNDTLVVFSNMYFDNTTTTNVTAIYEVNYCKTINASIFGLYSMIFSS